GEEGGGGVEGAVGVAVGGGGAAGVHLAGFEDDDRSGAGDDASAAVGDDLQAAYGDADRVLVVRVRGVLVPVEAGGEQVERRPAPAEPGPGPACLLPYVPCVPHRAPPGSGDQTKSAVSRSKAHPRAVRRWPVDLAAASTFLLGACGSENSPRPSV